MVLYSNYTDQQLVLLLQSGDITAFTEIHNRYYGLLYAHAYKRLPAREEIRDILQELFISLWNNRTQNFTGYLSGYLYTSVRNRILNVYKHKKIRSDYISSFQEFLAQTEPIADEIIRGKELAALIEKEVAALPAQMREVFEMSRNAHLSHQEIAERLNISPLTVKKQVSNSLKILRTKLGSYFYTFFL